MSKFLSRKILGLPLWLWLLGTILCAIAAEKLWTLLFGGGAAYLALREAANEASDRADELLNQAHEQVRSEAQQDAAIQEISDKAKLDAINEVASFQDSDSEFME